MQCGFFLRSGVWPSVILWETTVLVGSQTCVMLYILLTSDIWLLDAEGERTEGVTKPPLSHEYFFFWLYPDNTHHLNNTKELRFLVAKATRDCNKWLPLCHHHPNWTVAHIICSLSMWVLSSDLCNLQHGAFCHTASIHYYIECSHLISMQSCYQEPARAWTVNIFLTESS